MTTTTAFPDTPDALQEAMNDPAWFAEHFADKDKAAAALAEYGAKFHARDKGFARQLEDAAAAGALKAMRDMGVAKDSLPGPGFGVDLHQKLHTTPARGSGARAAARRNPDAPGAHMDGIFSSFGDFIVTTDFRNVNVGGRTPELRAKLDKARQVMNAYSSFDSASAGFLMPEEVRSEIMQLVLEASIVRPRATVIPMSTQTLTMPGVDETTHSGSLFGGITFAWGAEAASIAVSEAKFFRVRLEANKLVGGATIPNELMADAPALTAWLNENLPAGLAWWEDLAFLRGTGAQQPLGVYGSSAMVTVNKETSQVADTLVFENVSKMFARMLPSSMNNAVWVCNQALIPQLLALSIPVGTGGAPVMLVDAHASPNWTMLGRPIVFTEKASAIGDLYDIALLDLSYYLIGDRQAVSVDSSEHSQFMADSTQVRIISRVDGRPWINSALTPAKGSDTLSPFVTLQAR